MTAGEHRKKRILLVLPPDPVREIVREMLNDQGYDARIAEGDEQTEDSIRSGGTDLLLLDSCAAAVRNPGFLGAVTSVCKEHRVPIVLLSPRKGAIPRSELLHTPPISGILDGFASLDAIVFLLQQILFPPSRNSRVDPRARIFFPVVYSYGNVREESMGFTLSRNGMFIMTRTLPPRKTKLRVRFWVPGSPHVLESDATIVWRNEYDPTVTKAHPPGMGVRLSGLTEEEQALIERMVSFHLRF
jgi:CheY-like chemotaxis protein